MAIGDAAALAGYAVVPNTGEAGKVKYGAQEINRTRDYLAALKALLPTSKSGFRTATGMYSGTSAPTSGTGASGDWYAEY